MNTTSLVVRQSLAAIGFAATLLSSVNAQTPLPEYPQGLVYELIVTKSSWDKNVGLTIETKVIGQKTDAEIIFHFPSHHENAGVTPAQGIARTHAISIRPGAKGGAELDSAFRERFQLALDQTLFLKDGSYRALSGLTLQEIASQGGNIRILADPILGQLDYSHRLIYDKAAGKAQLRLNASKAFIPPKREKPPQ